MQQVILTDNFSAVTNPPVKSELLETQYCALDFFFVSVWTNIDGIFSDLFSL